MFKELARKQKQIPREECIDLLIKETRGVLAVNGEGGYPYAMPMNHYYNQDDGCIYFHCGKKGHRTEALTRCDKVCFCLCEEGTREDGDWALTVRSVIVFGRVQMIDRLEDVAEITARLSRKFTEDEEYIKNEIERFAKATLLLKLVPEHICGKRVKES